MRSAGTPLLRVGADLHEIEFVAASDEWDDTLAAGNEPHSLRAMTGDRRTWPNAINSFTARGRNTGGRYFSVLTTAAPQP